MIAYYSLEGRVNNFSSIFKLILLLMISVNVLFSQEIGTTKVKVMEGFKPFIPDAKRLSQNATFADTIKKDRTQNFEVLDADLKSNYKVRTLRSAKVKPDKLSNLYIYLLKNLVLIIKEEEHTL